MKNLLNDSNVNRADELIEIITMQEYSRSLLFKSNRDYINTNIEENIKEQLNMLYDAQLEEKLMTNNNILNKGCCTCICRDNWEIGQNRCARNYAISTAVTWIAGGFTLGIGTAVGSIATAAYYVNCMAETQSDAEKCNSNC